MSVDQKSVQSWMDGFDSMFDAFYFDSLGSGEQRRINLSELGVLSHTPYFGGQLPPAAGIPVEAIKVIKQHEGYIGMTDAIRFALGARAAFIALGSPFEREKPSTGSAHAESGFIPEGAIGKTVGLSYRTEANL